ncbi:unnamed protein product [Cuscuta epithymum]|uniref:RNase H type-1 domain-containing protein n=1 Tax=Cuscuta epithymum TaxID=186058 RepID=A0AAV0EIE2_9ASTE|nr:unnamed protein product [Cuscuta epithymum]
MKNNQGFELLREEELLDPCFRKQQRRIKLIKWMRPHTIKLNIDAAHILGFSSGGALLRDAQGEMIFAISFRILVDSPLHAVRWAISVLRLKLILSEFYLSSKNFFFEGGEIS